MTITGGVIQALSASQAEEFDPQQTGGCPRRWYFHRIARVPVPESGRAQEDGDAGHAHFALYYRTGRHPRRARMSKAVNGALDKGELPAREPGQLIESRFGGQPARDTNGERLPLDATRTLWLGGVPWDGYVDLRFCRTDPFGPLAEPGVPAAGGTITILDHKFSSDIHAYAKSDLLATVQMPVYALDSLRIWPNTERVELIHHYVSRRGVDSFIRRQVVTVEQVRQRGQEIAGLVQQMQAAAAAPRSEDVPGNRASCHSWSGCPFQSRCSVFKEKPKMNLSSDELEWLNVVGGGAAEAKPKESPRCGLCGGAPDHAHGDCPSLTKPAVSGPDADRATELEIPSAAGALDPAGDDPFAVFEAPKPSVPQEQTPACEECGTELNAENGSQRDGVWKHIGCTTPDDMKAMDDARGIVDAEERDSGKCPNCPHPVHPGAACTGKRGRGACRCGVSATKPSTAAGEVFAEMAGPKPATDTPGDYTARIPLGAEPIITRHFPACVQNDAGKWLCVEGCILGKTLQEIVPLGAEAAAAQYQAAQASPEGLSDALNRERDMHRRTLAELDASERALKLTTERLREAEQQSKGGPVPMLLWCPACHARHLDVGEFAEKPHHTHACQSCGLAWRPAIVATIGVQFLPGFRN